MAPLDRFLNPIRRAVVAFFRHDLRLRRSRDGLAVVLTERPAAPAAGVGKQRVDAQAERERQERHRMLAELSSLLDEQPGSRQTLRHLVFVQQVLTKKGLKALHWIPLDVLQRALVQLETLVTNWSPVGLANLRSKMAVAIIDREHSDPDAEADAYRTTAILESHGSGPPPLPEVIAGDEAALAAAYAAFGAGAPVATGAGAGAAAPTGAGAGAGAGAATVPDIGLAAGALGGTGVVVGVAAAADAAAAVDSRAVALEYLPELGSPSARAVAAAPPRPSVRGPDIELRVLQD